MQGCSDAQLAERVDRTHHHAGKRRVRGLKCLGGVLQPFSKRFLLQGFSVLLLQNFLDLARCVLQERGGFGVDGFNRRELFLQLRDYFSKVC